MKLSVSNLAWPKEENDWCLDQLVKYGISGVELAPLKLFDSWDSITAAKIAQIKEKVNSLGLKVSSFQAITFGADDLALLGEKSRKDNFVNHMEKVAKLLANLGGDFAVFGSPGLRSTTDFDEQELIATLSQVESVFKKYDVCLAVETVPAYYGCQVLNKLKKTDVFLNKLGEKSFVVRHFDTACQYLSGDLCNSKFHEFLGRSKHLHISEVDLNTFLSPSQFNLDIIPAVKKHYKGEWCTLEMGDENYSRESFLGSIKNFTRLFSI